MKPTLPTLFLAATLCASGFVTRPARAQFSGGLYGIYHVPIDIAGMNERRIALDASSQVIENTGNKSTRNVRRTPKKALTTTTYHESPAVTKRTVTRFTNWISTQTNATDAAAIRRDFENDMLGRWAKGVSETGLKRGDVADALTTYWVANWQIANRVTSDPTNAQVRAVRRLFVSVLSSTPAFARATNAQRQEMAEGYIHGAVLQSAAFAQIFHTGDKALLQRYSDGRAASFKTEMGFDLRTVQLTDTGFKSKA
jgi:hypothetical protein